MAALPNDKNNDTGSTPLGSTRNDSSEDEDFDEVTSQFPLRSGERSDVTMTTTDAEDEEDPDPRMITRGAGSLRKFGSTAGAKGSTSGGLEAIHENVAMSSVDKVTLTMVKLGFDESLGFVDLPGLRERATTLKEIEEELDIVREQLDDGIVCVLKTGIHSMKRQVDGHCVPLAILLRAVVCELGEELNRILDELKVGRPQSYPGSEPRKLPWTELQVALLKHDDGAQLGEDLYVWVDRLVHVQMAWNSTFGNAGIEKFKKTQARSPTDSTMKEQLAVMKEMACNSRYWDINKMAKHCLGVPRGFGHNFRDSAFEEVARLLIPYSKAAQWDELKHLLFAITEVSRTRYNEEHPEDNMLVTYPFIRHTILSKIGLVLRVCILCLLDHGDLAKMHGLKERITTTLTVREIMATARYQEIRNMLFAVAAPRGMTAKGIVHELLRLKFYERPEPLTTELIDLLKAKQDKGAGALQVKQWAAQRDSISRCFETDGAAEEPLLAGSGVDGRAEYENKEISDSHGHAYFDRNGTLIRDPRHHRDWIVVDHETPIITSSLDEKTMDELLHESVSLRTKDRGIKSCIQCHETLVHVFMARHFVNPCTTTYFDIKSDEVRRVNFDPRKLKRSSLHWHDISTTECCGNLVHVRCIGDCIQKDVKCGGCGKSVQGSSKQFTEPVVMMLAEDEDLRSMHGLKHEAKSPEINESKFPENNQPANSQRNRPLIVPRPNPPVTPRAASRRLHGQYHRVRRKSSLFSNQWDHYDPGHYGDVMRPYESPDDVDTEIEVRLEKLEGLMQQFNEQQAQEADDNLQVLQTLGMKRFEQKPRRNHRRVFDPSTDYHHVYDPKRVHEAKALLRKYTGSSSVQQLAEVQRGPHKVQFIPKAFLQGGPAADLHGMKHSKPDSLEQKGTEDEKEPVVKDEAAMYELPNREYLELDDGIDPDCYNCSQVPRLKKEFPNGIPASLYTLLRLAELAMVKGDNVLLRRTFELFSPRLWPVCRMWLHVRQYRANCPRCPGPQPLPMTAPPMTMAELQHTQLLYVDDEEEESYRQWTIPTLEELRDSPRTKLDIYTLRAVTHPKSRFQPVASYPEACLRSHDPNGIYKIVGQVIDLTDVIPRISSEAMQHGIPHVEFSRNRQDGRMTGRMTRTGPFNEQTWQQNPHLTDKIDEVSLTKMHISWRYPRRSLLDYDLNRVWVTIDGTILGLHEIVTNMIRGWRYGHIHDVDGHVVATVLVLCPDDWHKIDPQFNIERFWPGGVAKDGVLGTRPREKMDPCRGCGVKLTDTRTMCPQGAPMQVDSKRKEMAGGVTYRVLGCGSQREYPRLSPWTDTELARIKSIEWDPRRPGWTEEAVRGDDLKRYYWNLEDGANIKPEGRRGHFQFIEKKGKCVVKFGPGLHPVNRAQQHYDGQPRFRGKRQYGNW